MPRRIRVYISGLPYHIVQRTNNREACFVGHDDYQFYLELWKECSKRYGVALHAYCLMTNHAHFLVTPETNDSISRLTRVVGIITSIKHIKDRVRRGRCDISPAWYRMTDIY